MNSWNNCISNAWKNRLTLRFCYLNKWNSWCNSSRNI